MTAGREGWRRQCCLTVYQYTYSQMHTHIYIHFHTSHISHIRANTRHELLTADFASPHTADGPAYPGRPAADHLQLRLGLCARQHNQSQPSLRTHALSGTPDGAFCRRVQHPPPAHSSPAPCTCPPKPPAPLSTPNDRTPGRAPAPGSLSHSLRGHKTACAETVSRRSCSDTPHTAPKHINAAQKPPSPPPSASAPAQPISDAKRGGLGGAQSTGGARQVAATCTERFGPRCHSGEKWRSSAHTRKPISAPQKPNATTHSVFGTILGLSHARAGLWGRCGTALARGHPNRGRSQRRIPCTDSSNRSLRTQTDRCRGRRTSCGRPLVPQAQRAPQCRRSKPPYPFPGLLPGLAAGRIAEAVVASTTEGRSDGGLARKKSRRYSRGALAYPQGKPLKPS